MQRKARGGLDYPCIGILMHLYPSHLYVHNAFVFFYKFGLINHVLVQNSTPLFNEFPLVISSGGDQQIEAILDRKISQWIHW